MDNDYIITLSCMGNNLEQNETHADKTDIQFEYNYQKRACWQYSVLRN